MITRQQVVDGFVAAGANPYVFMERGCFSLPDVKFETCSEEFVQKSYDDLLAMLPAKCVDFREIGGGKEIYFMRHTMKHGDTTNESGDCDTHGHVFMAHCVVGNWVKSLRTGISRGGLGLGVLDYTAEPKPEDMRVGGHNRNWFYNHDHVLRWFEPGDNAFTTMTRSEVASLFFGRAV